ncbi:MAG TPA: glycosyltransferase, partial [Pirellulales bacterium]|nr:glycosyltransferase [Pirellulales bacterium]
MTDLSIVIPAQNKFEAFERTLLSVLERSPKRCEIIVVVDNAYADPYDLDGEVRFVRVDDGATLASSLNAGLIASRGEFVHVLAAGATATDDWAQNALRRFENSQVAAVASRIVYADDPVHVHSAGIHYCRGGGLKFIGHGDATEHCMSLLETIDSPHALAGFYRRTALGQLRELFCTRLGGLSSTVDLGLR